MNNEIKGIIFDLDGTLLDTEGYQWDGWVIPLREFGIELTLDDYLKYAGRSGGDIDKELIERFALDVAPGTILAMKKVLLEEWFREKELSFTPFAEESVRFCRDNGYAVALCSGGYKEEVMLKLERKGLADYFDIIICGSDVKRNKPFPDMYEKAVGGLGLVPDQCLALEDTQYGLQAAKDAGLRCFAIPHRFSRGQDFSRADKVLDTLEGLIDYLND
ncbi:MAG: HAD family phosphatase [Candidatus Pacebacteria bacterium]|nr:HAD family phosphatase [Candidatus Paceibacterota bacterium]